MAEYLFKVQQKNRLSQKGILKRFSINCYGKQLQLTDMRIEKAEKYEELKNKKHTKEYEEWFLRYFPEQIYGKKNDKKKTKKNKKQSKKTIKKSVIKKSQTKKRKNGLFKRLQRLF
jgi:hypothetical protein